MKFSGNVFTGTGTSILVVIQSHCLDTGIFRILRSSEIEPLSVNMYVSP